MPRTKKAQPEEPKDVAASEPKKRGRKQNTISKVAEPKKGEQKKVKKRAYTSPVPQVYFQIGGQEYNCTAVQEKACADYRATHRAGIHSCRVYIKPEEGTVYYVINKVEGKIPLE